MASGQWAPLEGNGGLALSMDHYCLIPTYPSFLPWVKAVWKLIDQKKKKEKENLLIWKDTSDDIIYCFKNSVWQERIS